MWACPRLHAWNLRTTPVKASHDIEAERAMQFADSVVFMGTSFSVNITSIALRYALSNNARIEIVDPDPIDLNISGIKYHKMTASEYISEFDHV